jgi:Transposase DDE domain group 1
MTSFSGLVVFQLLFKRLELKARLRRAFGAADRGRSFGLAVVVLQLVVQVLLGFRRLRDRDYFADDPLLCRVMGVLRLPDVATVSRTLASATAAHVEALRQLLRELVLDRLSTLELATVTLDFDGSVQSTRRHAEGSAVGYNKQRKGARSYYPLLCTVSQTGQFLDLHHRPGNVHDSRDAESFVEAKIADVRRVLPRARIEARFDSAFFSETMLALLERLGVEYAVSVPFERFPGLRGRIMRRTSGWTRIDDDRSFIELGWRPKSWSKSDTRRFIAVRTRRLVRRKGPLQLDLFEPRDCEHEYKVFVTNKTVSAAAALLFHNGRGNQEATIGEGKHWAALDYVPCRRLVSNQIYSVCALLAHNLGRELQMAASEPRVTRALPSRAALFDFSTLGTLRDLVLRRAGSLTRPSNRLTLTIAATGPARQTIEHFMQQLQSAA